MERLELIILLLDWLLAFWRHLSFGANGFLKKKETHIKF